jgi:hypothetical protein
VRLAWVIEPPPLSYGTMSPCKESSPDAYREQSCIRKRHPQIRGLEDGELAPPPLYQLHCFGTPDHRFILALLEDTPWESQIAEHFDCFRRRSLVELF